MSELMSRQFRALINAHEVADHAKLMISEKPANMHSGIHKDIKRLWPPNQQKHSENALAEKPWIPRDPHAIPYLQIKVIADL